MPNKTKIIIAALFVVFLAVVYISMQERGPLAKEFTVKNFVGTELGKISVNYTQPLDQYGACEIAKVAATQTSLEEFKCTGYKKEGENWQIVYQPSPANVFVFSIDEKQQEISINIGQANG